MTTVTMSKDQSLELGKLSYDEICIFWSLFVICDKLC